MRSCTGPTRPSGDRIAEIRDNLTARITEANREGWLGEAEGLKISLAGAQDKLPRSTGTRTPARVQLGMPALSRTPSQTEQRQTTPSISRSFS